MSWEWKLVSFLSPQCQQHANQFSGQSGHQLSYLEFLCQIIPVNARQTLTFAVFFIILYLIELYMHNVQQVKAASVYSWAGKVVQESHCNQYMSHVLHELVLRSRQAVGSHPSNTAARSNQECNARSKNQYYM